MRRVLLPLAVLIALLAPAQAGAASSHSFDVPSLLGRALKAVKGATDVPILVPSRVSAEFTRLYSFGVGRSDSYEFELSSAKRCHGANVCFVAGFTAQRGERPSGAHKVTLTGGQTGYYEPVHCGASCAPAGIEWRQDGVLYSIQSKLGTKSTDRKLLVGLANSAIRGGPR